jgi:hypothetical protein
MLFGGNEISALDGTVDIVKTYGNGIPFLDGKTVIESPLALVPRSIYGEDKPYGGASTIYTQRLYASNYGKERSELLSSAVGEAYMNYSLLGVLPFFIAIGSLVAGAYHLAFRNNVPRSPELLLFYSLFMARFLAYLRGDLFGFVGQSFNILLVTFLVNWAIKAASRGIEARRRQTI